AGLEGHDSIAAGNVIGSNIFNIAFILGLSALILPMKVHINLIRRDVPVMIAAALTMLLFMTDKKIGRIEGLILVLGGIIYTAVCAYRARKEPEADIESIEPVKFMTRLGWLADVALILVGLAVLVAGSKLLVNGSVVLARHLGISEAVIGLTVIAAGTSLPELATSIIAAIKKQPDIAIGNVVGSNIFNVLFVLGGAAMVTPLSTNEIRNIDMYVMIGLSLLLLPFLRSGFTLSRKEGAIMFLIYLGYTYTLIPH
ncbi:MAG: calcium/sodium antiporter, partial [Victivallaceae bacterium]